MTKLTRMFRGIAPAAPRRAWSRGDWWTLGLSVVALAGAWFMVINGFPIGAVQVVTHYSIPFGIDGIGPWWHVWLIPATATTLTLIHLFALIPWSTRRSTPSAHFVRITTVLVNVGVVWAIFLLRYQELPV